MLPCNYCIYFEIYSCNEDIRNEILELYCSPKIFRIKLVINNIHAPTTQDDKHHHHSVVKLSWDLKLLVLH